jgi:hypothetical protein
LFALYVLLRSIFFLESQGNVDEVKHKR